MGDEKEFLSGAAAEYLTGFLFGMPNRKVLTVQVDPLVTNVLERNGALGVRESFMEDYLATKFELLPAKVKRVANLHAKYAPEFEKMGVKFWMCVRRDTSIVQEIWVEYIDMATNPYYIPEGKYEKMSIKSSVREISLSIARDPSSWVGIFQV